LTSNPGDSRSAAHRCDWIGTLIKLAIGLDSSLARSSALFAVTIAGAVCADADAGKPNDSARIIYTDIALIITFSWHGRLFLRKWRSPQSLRH
jgi:hypothetical protein